MNHSHRGQEFLEGVNGVSRAVEQSGRAAIRKSRLIPQFGDFHSNVQHIGLILLVIGLDFSFPKLCLNFV